MSNLASLKEEHAQLLDIVRRLGAMIAKNPPPSSMELAIVRRELMSTLIRHLKAEDWLFYPRLLDNPDPVVAETALRFNKEMGGLAGAFMTYVEKWGSMAIEKDWPGYCRETAAIAQVLTERITRENRDLYPLIEKLDQAA
jgi:hypothetical protein